MKPSVRWGVIERRIGVLSLMVLVGCGAPSEGVWLEGFGFEWEHFNHRLSYVDFSTTDDAIVAGVVGGTSTTGVSTDLAEGCDSETCREFPFFDDVLVDLRWGRARSREVAFGTGTVAVMADADGRSGEVSVPLPRRVKGDVVAIVRGIRIDTARPLEGGEACYRPEYGWLPSHLSVGLRPALSDDGRSVDVELTASFESGPTHEEERTCLDEVVDRSEVSVEVDVLVVAGAVPGEASAVEQSMSYDYGDGPASPAPQPAPEPATLDSSALGSDVLVGWSGLDFRFHRDEPEPRGAYLRTLRVAIDVEEGTAYGHATNFSPATQLSGFDYRFEGIVERVPLDVEIERGHIEASLPAELDEDGRPVTQSLPLDEVR